MNNPIIFIDPDGREVKPANQAALALIQKGLTPQEATYIRLNEAGMIDRDVMQIGLKDLGSVGGNYEALMILVNAKEITEVITAKDFNAIDATGKSINHDFGEVLVSSVMDEMWSYEKEAWENAGKTKADYEAAHPSYSKEVTVDGFLGVTLYGDKYGGYGKSTTGNTQVIVNERAPEKIQTSTQAHENYGHNLFKQLGKPHSHGEIKSLSDDSEKNNKALENQIYNREKEAEENYDKH